MTQEQIPSREAASRALETYDRDFLLGLYERMVLIREFEDGVKFLFLEGSMPGTIHQCQGQEATAVGVCAALEAGDFITSTFRGHGHALAKGLTVEELLFELFGASTGCCRGKGGSMHVGNMDKGMVPGHRDRRRGHPARRGDGPGVQDAEARRASSPASSATAPWPRGRSTRGSTSPPSGTCPSIFVCENNLYGASTRVDEVMRNPRIADRAARLRHPRRDGRRQRRAGRLRGGPDGRRRMPRRPGPGPARAAHLPPDRPLPPRRLPLPAEGGARGVARAATRSSDSPRS